VAPRMSAVFSSRRLAEALDDPLERLTFRQLPAPARDALVRLYREFYRRQESAATRHGNPEVSRRVGEWARESAARLEADPEAFFGTDSSNDVYFVHDRMIFRPMFDDSVVQVRRDAPVGQYDWDGLDDLMAFDGTRWTAGDERFGAPLDPRDMQLFRALVADEDPGVNPNVAAAGGPAALRSLAGSPGGRPGGN
jgi:hypothetical protein